ncbi:hypothetical protein ELI15_17135 [Rhizobium ruizarguesonis]|uniref:hypothetical protein n=1 Tax=Rhizobium ruizarguesonis TaxID=2081791 RepID=UPI001030BB28|nr:hypothetical protein [Rhizobium ruizarguesonis]TAW65986.1 hypothetical protein ELI15_17135 [Rhizobium ruizarguesonis]
MKRMGPLIAFLLILIVASSGAAYAPDPVDLKEARSEAREEANLAAQEKVAYWAFPMFVATGLSVLVSAVALVGLFGSLRQTKRAIKDNRELGEAQIRAYVEAENVEFASDGQALVVELLNMGQTPVVSFDVTTEILAVPEKQISQNIRLPVGRKKSFDGIGCGDHGRRPVRVKPAAGVELIDEFVGNVPPPGKACLVIGRIDYKDVFDREWTTGFAFYREGGSFLEPFHTLPTYRPTSAVT